MSMTAKNFCALCALISALVALPSCSTGPEAMKVGTPAFYWAAAKEAYAGGDYMKTVQQLDHLVDGNNEYTARALPWSLVLSSGMAEGYMDLADNYEKGAKMNRTDPAVYRGLVSNYRVNAGHLTLQFAEEYNKLAGLKDPSIRLAFGPPKGTATQPNALTRVLSSFPAAGCTTMPAALLMTSNVASS